MVLPDDEEDILLVRYTAPLKIAIAIIIEMMVDFINVVYYPVGNFVKLEIKDW